MYTRLTSNQKKNSPVYASIVLWLKASTTKPDFIILLLNLDDLSYFVDQKYPINVILENFWTRIILSYCYYYYYFYFNYYYYVYMMCYDGGTYMWRSDDNFVELILYFHLYMGSSNQNHIVMLA